MKNKKIFSLLFIIAYIILLCFSMPKYVVQTSKWQNKSVLYMTGLYKLDKEIRRAKVEIYQSVI